MGAAGRACLGRARSASGLQAAGLGQCLYTVESHSPTFENSQHSQGSCSLSPVIPVTRDQKPIKDHPVTHCHFPGLTVSLLSRNLAGARADSFINLSLLSTGRQQRKRTRLPRAPSSSSSAPRRSRHFPGSRVLSAHCEHCRHWREVGQRCPSEVNPQIPLTRLTSPGPGSSPFCPILQICFNSGWRTEGLRPCTTSCRVPSLPPSLHPTHAGGWGGGGASGPGPGLLCSGLCVLPAGRSPRGCITSASNPATDSATLLV